MTINSLMKNFMLAIFVTVLAGCSMLNTSDFDNVEYNDFIVIMTLAEQTIPACDRGGREILSRALHVDAAAHHLENYTSHRVNNGNTLEIATIIRETTTELVDRYEDGEGSPIYCKAKLNNIVSQAKIGADAVQKKVRR